MMIDGSIRVCLESFAVWMKDTIGTPKKKIQIIIEFHLMVSASDDNSLSSD